jgi:hypothetical protein
MPEKWLKGAMRFYRIWFQISAICQMHWWFDKL